MSRLFLGSFVPVLFACALVTTRAPGQSHPGSTVGSDMTGAQSDALNDVLTDLTCALDECLTPSSPCPGCEVLANRSAELLGYLDILWHHWDTWKLKVGTCPNGAMMSSPDLCDEGFWDGSGVDTWNAESSNWIRMDPSAFSTTSSAAAQSLIMGSMLLHEVDHFDDEYTFTNGTPTNPPPANLCSFYAEELAAHDLELALLDCFACCRELDDEAEDALDARADALSQSKSSIEQAKTEAGC